MTTTLLCDMDTPLAGFDERVLDVCRENGWEMDIDDVSQLRHRYSTNHIPDPEHRAAFKAMYRQAGWFRSLPVVEGAKEGLERAARKFDEVWICTRMPHRVEWDPSWATEKVAWLQEHFSFEWSQRLIICSDKSVVNGTLLLDDAPETRWFGRAKWKPVIFSTGYNGADSEWAGLPRWDWSQPIGDLATLRDAARLFPDAPWPLRAQQELERVRGW